MRILDLHTYAYLAFRRYLDAVYASGGGAALIGLCAGYPIDNALLLPQSVLLALRQDESGREKRRLGYGWEAGSASLRQLIVEYENTLHKTNYAILNVCMVAGATYGLNRVLELLFADGKDSRKELLVVAPTYYRMLGRAERFARIVSCVADDCSPLGPTVAEILHDISDDTRVVLLLNPANPSFKYLADQQLEELINALGERNIVLVIDESGDAFKGGAKWAPRPFPSRIQAANVVRIISASKKYLLAEHRIGYVLGDANIIGHKMRGLVKLVGDDMGNAPLSANEAWQILLQADIEHMEGTSSPETHSVIEGWNMAQKTLNSLRGDD